LAAEHDRSRPLKKVILALAVLALILVGARYTGGGIADDLNATKGAVDTTTTSSTAVESTSTTLADGGSSTTTTAPGGDVVDVVVQPGLSDDGFVGAREDVTLDRCEHVADGWIAGGEVSNTSGSDADYRIYVALNVDDSSETRALVQVDASVADGDSAPWEVTVPIADPDGLSCVLRVERVKA